MVTFWIHKSTQSSIRLNSCAILEYSDKSNDSVGLDNLKIVLVDMVVDPAGDNKIMKYRYAIIKQKFSIFMVAIYKNPCFFEKPISLI